MQLVSTQFVFGVTQTEIDPSNTSHVGRFALALVNDGVNLRRDAAALGTINAIMYGTRNT
jgi:hypothetical protein